MMSSTTRRCSVSSLSGRTVAQHLPEKTLVHLQAAAGHDVVERRHALEQCDVLERSGDAAARGGRRAHAAALFALESDAAMCRVIETVDAVQHRRLAGPIRADDRADFALADVERNIRERLDAAESERHVLDREQRLGLRDDGAVEGLHAAFSSGPMAPGRRSMSRI